MGVFFFLRPSPKTTSSTISWDSHGGRGVFSSTVIPLKQHKHNGCTKQSKNHTHDVCQKST